MKKIYTLFAFAAILSAALSCNKEVNVAEEPITDNERVVEFSTEPMTKTVFGTLDGTSYPTLWTTEKTVAVSLNYGTAKASTTPVLASGGATATFSASLADDSSGAYKIYAVSPFSAIVSTSSFNSSHKDVKIVIEADQTPSATSVDEDDQILTAVYDAGSTFPTSAVMNFSHITAYGLMSLENLTLAPGESIASVSLTSTLDWVGQFFYYYENDGDNEAGDVVASAGSNTINITTSSASNIWFACAPVAIGGTGVNLVVTTNTGTTYSKVISFPAGRKFQSGHVAKFAVDMDGITADGASVYNLVTDPNELTVGSEVLIVAKNFDYAIGTQNANNRAQASITKSGSAINSPSASVTAFTLGRGYNDNYYSFKTGDNYLDAPGSGNNLRETNELGASSSWRIAIDGENVASVTSTNTSASQIVLSYNENNEIFSCYTAIQRKNVDSEYGYLTLYKLDGSGNDSQIITYIDMPSSKALETGASATSLGATTNSSATITYATSNASVATVDASGNVTPVGTGSCSITASVAAAGNYLATSATCAVTVSSAEVWKLTDLSNITTDDTFVIVGTNTYGSYALPHTNGSSSAPGIVSVTTTTGGGITKISGAVADGIKWHLTGNATDGYVFLPNGSTTTWLYITNTNNGVRVGTYTYTTINKVKTYDIEKFKLDANSYLQNVGISSRYLSIYVTGGNPTDWRCYANTDSAPTITFYVLQ